jgi:hypothetical protein
MDTVSSGNSCRIKDMAMEYTQRKMNMTQEKMRIMDNTMRIRKMVMDARCLLIEHIMDSTRMVNFMEKECFIGLVRFTKPSGKMTISSVKLKFESPFT